LGAPLRTSDKIWLIWFALWFTFFLVYEFYWLVTGRPENTLSAAIWRFVQFKQGQSFFNWSATHFLGFGVYVIVSVWLFFHFFFHKFT
jgi:hypothetical protein